MAMQSQVVVLILTGIISSIIGYIQLNIVMLSYQTDYERMRATFVWLLSKPVARNMAVVRPGRTNAWWSSSVNQIVVSEE